MVLFHDLWLSSDSMIPRVASVATRRLIHRQAFHPPHRVTSLKIHDISRSVCRKKLPSENHANSSLFSHHRPVKKKGGTAAGVPRTVGEAQSATAGASKDQVRAVQLCCFSLVISVHVIFIY